MIKKTIYLAFILILLTSCTEITSPGVEKSTTKEIYFSDYSVAQWPDSAEIASSMIHKMENGKISIINRTPASFINVKNDWIYFLNRKENKIYRTSKDGKLLEKVSNELVATTELSKSVIVYEDDICYLSEELDNKKIEDEIYDTQKTFYLKKMSLDGTECEYVTRVKIASFEVWDNVIYYTVFDGSAAKLKLYKHVDGSSKDELITEGLIDKYIVKDNYVYFILSDSTYNRYDTENRFNRSLVRINLSNFALDKIKECISDYGLFDNNIIVSTKAGLELLNNAGEKLHDIYKTKNYISDINVLEDIILFHSVKYSEELLLMGNSDGYYPFGVYCCIKTDGSQFRIIDNIFDAANESERDECFNIYEDRENAYRFSYPSNWILTDRDVYGNWAIQSIYESISGGIGRDSRYKSKQQVIETCKDEKIIIYNAKTNDGLDALMILGNEDRNKTCVSCFIFKDDVCYNFNLYMSKELYDKYEFVILDMIKRFKVL